jgi:hypothetical protein
MLVLRTFDPIHLLYVIQGVIIHDMSRESLVLLFGIIIFITPSLGIPEEWKGYIYAGSGIILIIVGYILRRSAYLRSIDTGNGGRETDSFVESTKRDPVAVITEDKM